MIAFPELYPTGSGGINDDREVKLTKSDFYSCRFLNKNKMFAKNSDYLFVAQQYVERTLLESNISVAGHKGKIGNGESGK